MRTLAIFLAGVVALAAPVCTGLRAQPGPQPVAAGRVLVLENERLLEGDVERRGEQYVVRRHVGELWLPARKVLKMCGSRDEAFMFICGRANMRDPDERVRVARWCHLNGLYEQALIQASVAAEMRPTDRETQQFLAVMKRAAESARHAPAPKLAPAAAEQTVPASIDVSLEALGAFTNRVQPILMNACARCHANGQGGEFKLRRAFEGDSLNRRATQHNLAIVLAQVNADKPYLSPFLTRAVSVHGGSDQPPLKGRTSEPYRILQEWVEITVAENPHLQQERWSPPGVVQASAPGSFAAAVPPAAATAVPVQTAPTPQPAPPALLPSLSAVPLAPATPTSPPASSPFAAEGPRRPAVEQTPAAPPQTVEDPYSASGFPGNQQQTPPR